MEKPYRYKKKLIKFGGSLCVVIPSVNGWSKVKQVFLEVFDDKIVITKAEEK